MPAAPKLTPEQWATLRAEFEAGGGSIRALAEKYGVSDAAIRKRAADTTQPGGAWRREDQGPSIDQGASRAAGKVAKRITGQGAEGSQEGSREPSEGEGSQFEGSHKPSPLKPAYNNPVTFAMADPAFRQALREEVIDSVAEALAHENSQHIESRVGPLKTLFARLLSLLNQAMTTPDPTDQEAIQRQALAQAALIVGRGDSMGAHLQALIKLSETIQTQMRRALGVDDRMKKVGVELSGPGGLPIQSQQMVAVADLTKLSTAEMQQLYEAALILEGGRERPPVPLPPGDPPVPGAGEGGQPS